MSGPSRTGLSTEGWGSVLRRDRWLRPYLARYRKVLAAALSLGVLAQLFAMGLMFTSGYLISASALVSSIIVLHVPLARVQLFGLGKPLASYGERLASHDWVLRMTSSLRTRLFSAYGAACRSDGGRFGRAAAGALGLLSEDVAHIQNLYLRCVFPTVVAWAACVAALFAFGALSLPFFLVMLAVLFVTAVVFPLVSVAVNGARIQRERALRRRCYDRLADDLAGAADWRLSGRREDFLGRQLGLDDEMRALQRRRVRFDCGRTVALTALLAGASAAVCLWAASRFAGGGPAEASWMCAFAIGVFPLFDAVALLGGACEEAASHKDAVARLNGLREEGRPGGGSGRAKAAPDGPADGDAPTRRPGARADAPEAPGAASLRFRDVSFSYGAPDGRGEGRAPGASAAEPVVDGLSLDIEAGQKVAVLGPSGTGKSTFASLASGMLSPTAGRVLVGRLDLAQLDEARRASLVSFVGQDPYVFDLTIRENLRIGDPAATDEELMAALGAVGLGEKVAALPEGLSTYALEAGSRFSGGERQRIALARAFLTGAPLLVLDEPFASLDAETERQVSVALMGAFSSRTVVAVTHNDANLDLFDRVLEFS